MNDPQTSTDAISPSPRDAVSVQVNASRPSKASFVVALIALILSWFASFYSPIAARQAAARGDYDQVYTFAAIAWPIVIALDLAALALGIVGARRPVGKVRSGAAIAIGATGVIGFFVFYAGSLLAPTIT